MAQRDDQNEPPQGPRQGPSQGPPQGPSQGPSQGPPPGPSAQPPTAPRPQELPRPQTRPRTQSSGPRPPVRLPPPLPPTATTSIDPITGLQEPQTFCESFKLALYNPETGEVLYRTCTSWVLITLYSIMYLVFLTTFTLLCLFVSLEIIKKVVVISRNEYVKFEMLAYPEHGIGLSATPTSEGNFPLIWYKNGEKDDYEKYIQAIDTFLSSNRRKREVGSLGPCGEYPYGYGEKPCVIVRINKQFNWAGKPLHFNSTIAKSAPAEVQEWMKADSSKLWLQCSGYHSYDKEHIGKIKYYPDPPGFDASMFPLDAQKNSPLVAIQISEFTMGLSLAIQCKLWYDTGPSTIDFMLYVSPGGKLARKTVIG